MIFARRQQQAVFKEPGIVGEVFFLKSRTNFVELCKEFHRLRSRIREFHPDLIHAQYGTVTSLFCALTRVPLVITYRGSDLNPVPSMSKYRHAVGHVFSQVSALRARQIICVSEQLRDRLWWRRSRVSILPSGVDLSSFYPRNREAARDALGWDRNDFIVLFNASRAPAVKRLDIAIQAVEAAKSMVGDIRLVALKGDTDPQEVPCMMNASDCILMTSDFEGSPTIVQEAIACGLPVISVEVGDVADRLKDVSPSWIVSRDPVDIAKAIAEVAEQRPRTNGFQVAQAELGVGVIGTAIASIYASVANAASS